MEMTKINLNDIERHENSRIEINDVADLMSSIKQQGLLSPIVVCKNYKENAPHPWLLVAGNRRYTALLKLGYTNVDCFIKEDVINDKDLMLTNLSENLQRAGTSPYEEGRYMHALMNIYNMSLKEISIRLGINQNYISKALDAFSNTPEKYRNKLVYTGGNLKTPGKISLSVAAAINTIVKKHRLNSDQKNTLYSSALKNDLSKLKIEQIGHIISKGVPIDLAEKMKDNITYVRMDFAVSKSSISAIRKKYPGMSIPSITTKIVFGEMKENLSDPYKDIDKYLAKENKKKKAKNK